MGNWKLATPGQGLLTCHLNGVGSNFQRNAPGWGQQTVGSRLNTMGELAGANHCRWPVCSPPPTGNQVPSVGRGHCNQRLGMGWPAQASQSQWGNNHPRRARGLLMAWEFTCLGSALSTPSVQQSWGGAKGTGRGWAWLGAWEAHTQSGWGTQPTVCPSSKLGRIIILQLPPHNVSMGSQGVGQVESSQPPSWGNWE